MKMTVGIIFLVLLCSSCSSTFYYARLNQSQQDAKMHQLDNGDFKLENDSLWLAYCFNGASAPVQITVFNKSSRTMYIDWKKSSIMLCDRTYDYAKSFIDKDDIAPEIEYSESSPMLYTAQDKLLGVMDNEITFPDGVTRIPALTKLSYIPLRISNFKFGNLKLFKDSIVENKYKQLKRVDKIKYTESDTPLKMTSRIYTYSTKDKPLIIEDEFYLSEVMKTKSLPLKKLPQSVAESGDLFFVEKPSNNIFWKTSAKIGVGVGKATVAILGGITIFGVQKALGLEGVEIGN